VIGWMRQEGSRRDGEGGRRIRRNMTSYRMERQFWRCVSGNAHADVGSGMCAVTVVVVRMSSHGIPFLCDDGGEWGWNGGPSSRIGWMVRCRRR